MNNQLTFETQILLQSLQNLIEITKKRIDSNENDFVKEMKQMMSEKGWAKEMATIKFGGPRQIGHSTIVNRLAHHFRQNKMVCIIYPYFSMKFVYNDTVPIPESCIFTFDNLKDFPKGYNWETIFVDASSCLSSSQREKIYDVVSPVLSRVNKSVLVFVG